MATTPAAHGHYTGGRTDNQDTSAGTGAVCQQMPEITVGHKMRQEGRIGRRSDSRRIRYRIHAHAGSHQRHVVNYRRKQTDDGIDRVDVVHSLVETFSHSPQDAGAFQSGNGHQDTQEEKNGRHVYVLDDP